MRALRKRIVKFDRFANRVLDEYKATFSPDIEIPALSTFHNENYFPSGTIQSLVNMRQCINKIAKNNPNKHLGLLCLSSIVETVSLLRRDGRALRYVSDKIPADLCEAFRHQVEMVTNDLNTEPLVNVNKTGKIYLGDGRRPHRVLPKGIEAHRRQKAVCQPALGSKRTPHRPVLSIY